MKSKTKPTATVDGKEVEVEMVDEETPETPKEEYIIHRGRPLVMFLTTGLIIAGAIILSITLFIWALPVILPLIALWFIIKIIRGV